MKMSMLFSIRVTDYQLFREELFIRFTVRVYRKSLSMCDSFHFGFDGGIWDLIILVPDPIIVLSNFKYY